MSGSVAVVAAVDLGATSGRVMLGYVGRGAVTLVPTARFPNNPVRTPDGLHWNILELYRNVSTGLADALRREPDVRSIGVDSWAVDYALLRGGRMLGNPYHYRDDRCAPAAGRTHSTIPFEQLYPRNGLQFLPFNTVYQLVADRDAGWLEFADRILMIPDLVNFWLTGEARAEKTNASTTGLLDVHSREWDIELADRLGISPSILPRLIEPGALVGELSRATADTLGARRPVPVTAVGSHDTASAVAAVPAETTDFAYISCGTWSLVGLELEEPVMSEAARLENFTNEAGVDGRIRFLKNVSGLWLLNESVRTWELASGASVELAPLLEAASGIDETVPVFDVNDPVFVPPGDMPVRITAWYRDHDLPAPSSPAAIVRAILESLAHAYASTVEAASRLSGRRVDVVHIVGGGSQNRLLCQLTADRTGRTVVAGPVEATAIGNVLIQARAQGLLDGSLGALRDLVARTTGTVRYEPALRLRH
jgi:rhamnulokinase